MFLKKDDVFIVALRVLRENLVDGIMIGKLKNKLKERGFSEFGKDKESMGRLENLLKKVCEANSTQYTRCHYHLNPDGYILLLEYEQMQQARMQAKIAIFISLVSLIMSFIL